MDIVDTLNHLIPSDQLDESLIIGQNLECEAGNEFRTGLRLEDSRKNMLSDKDPMFGCASAQFNLLDNEDPAFQMAGSASPVSASAPAGLNSEVSPAETSQVKRIIGKQKKFRGIIGNRKWVLNESSLGLSECQPRMPTNTLIRGRPGRKPANRLSRSFLIEKGVKGPQLKKELTLGGRVNINDLDSRLWLNPTVVLRRLTVTIGGFKIELLPGPSYMQEVNASQSVCFDNSFSYGGDIGLAILPDDSVPVDNSIPESVAEMDGIEKSSADDSAHGLGPYVNPNDVQTSNGTLKETSCIQETKHNGQSVPVKPVSEENDGGENNSVTVSNESDGKEKEPAVAKTQIKSKHGATWNKSKDTVTCKTSNMNKEHKVSQNKPPKVLHSREPHKMKSLKDKQDVSPLKRPADNTQSEHTAKVQKVLGAGDVKSKPKSPSRPSSAVKKVSSPGNPAGDQLGPTKHGNSHHGSKVEATSQAHSHESNPFKASQEEAQEKFKLKKLEKILQRQKSKNARSISVEEPQLFVPDNAPAAKKEATEEQAANTESVWDGNNCCGLCKNHHNNMFMVGCGRCDDWFHGDCVGLDLAKVREMEEEDQMYVCLKCCDEESRKVEPEPSVKPDVPEKTEVQDHKLHHHHHHHHPRPGSSQTLASGGVRPVRMDPERRDSTDAEKAAHKAGNPPRHEMRGKASSLASKKPVSVDAIRRNVRDSLKEILIQRLKESDMNISVERASEVAKKTERELFHLNKDTDNKYKNKYRSLMFNLKDRKNNILFKRVLKGEISPSNLIRMSPEELASKELAAWRQRENRHTIEMIEKEQREAERRPITKITHKGEIEIESQEPVKAPDPIELEPPPRATEVPAEPSKTQERKAENTKTEKDTTSQHKSHLFDLHCKICTGRMAPPVEEAPTKVVKVATTVVRRQWIKTEETKSTTSPAIEDDLHLTVLEESFRNAQSSFELRTDHIAGRDEEAAFLLNLKPLWRGFIHMHSVAKLVTKAFPVSGILDNLTEDLPDSIQVGGRISPQTVWDYLEKIRATGTKEVCLVRFSPETEEDEISYTLLYAYFSSRRRFGVVSNNLKQVKDMYLIPLGATEKVPHQLVPFDGPGLENNRANLLLGLIIRQRPKRDFLPVDVNESARIVPEIKPIAISTKPTTTSEEEEKLFLSTLTPLHKKEANKPLDTTEDDPGLESLEEPSTAEGPSNQESQKPLRFLPGVLVGWGGELPPLPFFGDKPMTTVNDAPKSQQAPKTDASSGNCKGSTAAAPRFVIKKKEAKPIKAELELSSPADTSASNNSLGKHAAVVAPHASVTLKDKPPDVSTEAFLASLSAAPSGTEPSNAASANKSDAGLLSETEKGTSEGNSLLQPESQAGSDHTNGSKPPLSGILKKSSVYSTVDEDKTTVLQKDKASLPDTKPVPVLSSARKDVVLPFHQGYLQLSQARLKLGEQNQSFSNKTSSLVMGQTAAAVTRTLYPLEALCNTESSEPQHDPVKVPDLPVHNSISPSPLQQQAQISGSHDVPVALPPNTSSSLNAEDQSCSLQSAQEGSSLSPSEHQFLESPTDLSGQASSQARDYTRLDERYCDPWERPRNSEDRDHHGKHGHHHGKKSRHHDREREKKHDHDDKYREKSRHHGHSDDRHGERRKERHHSDDHSSRYKDRHRHKRDSDYENGRRSSKDSYSSF